MHTTLRRLTLKLHGQYYHHHTVMTNLLLLLLLPSSTVSNFNHIHHKHVHWKSFAWVGFALLLPPPHFLIVLNMLSYKICIARQLHYSAVPYSLL